MSDVAGAAMPSRDLRRDLSGGLFSLRGISVLIAAAIALLIVYPIGLMIWAVFGPGSVVHKEGLIEALARENIWLVLQNTVIVVAASGALAMMFGTLLAWLNERTDAGAGRMGEILPLMPLLMPQIAGVIGWVMLLAPRAGLLNVGLRSLANSFGIEVTSGPLDIYTIYGLIAIMALYLTPYVYLPVSSALKSLDPSLEEASRMAKANAFATFRRVTLPAIRPALLAGLLLVMMMGFAIFSVPVIIGSGAKIEMLPVLIYRLVYAYPARVDLAILLGLLLTVLVQVLLLLQTVLAPASLSAQIGGKAQRAARVHLGAWRWPARVLLLSFIVTAGVLPLLGLAFVSLQPFWTPNINVNTLGFDNYRTIFFNSSLAGKALVNSVVLGAVGGTIGMLIAALLSRSAQVSGSGMNRVIQAVTAAPAGVPHVVVAVGFILSFSSGWLNISGTWLILLLAYLVIFMPQAMRSASVAVAQVGKELTEAAAIFKAAPGRAFRSVMLPLMLPGLAAGWVILFVQMAGELTASALLAKTSNPVIGQVLLDLWQNGSFPEIAALALTATIINILVVTAVFAFVRRKRGLQT